MSSASTTIGKKGSVNLPGITAESKKTAEELLLKDAEDHHCFFNEKGFHNHLPHHILALYDIGTPGAALKKAYEEEAKIQRPKYLQERDRTIVVRKDNWGKFLNNISAYGAFVDFYEEEVNVLGVSEALEKYIFSDEANKDGRLMFPRFCNVVIHPLIQIGYGLEFGIDKLVVTGMAQAAMHNPHEAEVMQCIKIGPTSVGQGISLLEILRQLCDSPNLERGVYVPDEYFHIRLNGALMNGGTAQVQRLVSSYHITNNPTPEDITKSIEEIIWTATLLMFGTGKPGRRTRLDFFLMHIVTTSIFLKHLIGAMNRLEHKAAMIRGFIAVILLTTLALGRPRIDATLAMAPSAVPRLPIAPSSRAGKTAIGDPNDDADYNPWPGLVQGAQYHADVHVVKTMRTLLYAAQSYGTWPAGAVLGSKSGKGETYIGIGKVDGSLFVRCAGVLMDTMGWYGQNEGDWDRSGLGWEAAWDNED